MQPNFNMQKMMETHLKNRTALRSLFIVTAVLILLTATDFVSNSAFAGLSFTEGNKANIPRLPDDLPRHALVVGVGSYGANQFKGVIADAVEIAKFLHKYGFQVTLLKNPSQGKFSAAIDKFGKKLGQSKGLGFFYFAGVSMLVDGKMYFLPTGKILMDLSKQKTIRAAVSMEKLKNIFIAAKNPANMLVLDTNLNSHFKNQFNNQREIPPLPAPPNIIIAYAVQPGFQALENRKSRGQFTVHLLKHLGGENLEIRKVLELVRQGVMLETLEKQIPWYSSGLEKDFYFAQQKPRKGLQVVPSRKGLPVVPGNTR